MNKLERTWLTWKHRRKFARLGKGCQFPIPQLCVQGHVEMGDYCRFRNDVTLRTHDNGKIIFGTRSGLSWGCLAEAWDRIEIGNYTAIAEFSWICDSMPVLQGAPQPRDAEARITKPIRIGDNVFVGSGCIIGPGVTIGDGAVVGPFSIVTRDVGPMEIWTGAPARKMGHRTEGVPEEQLQAYRDMLEQQGRLQDRYFE